MLKSQGLSPCSASCSCFLGIPWSPHGARALLAAQSSSGCSKTCHWEGPKGTASWIEHGQTRIRGWKYLLTWGWSVLNGIVPISRWSHHSFMLTATIVWHQIIQIQYVYCNPPRNGLNCGRSILGGSMGANWGINGTCELRFEYFIIQFGYIVDYFDPCSYSHAMQYPYQQCFSRNGPISCLEWC